MNYPLTNSDINFLLKGRVNIVTYPEVSKFRNIDELLGKYKAAVILYLTSPNFGHWTGLFLNKEGLHFIDSYGGLPDETLEHIGAVTNKSLKQDFTYLIALMVKSPYDLYYNDHKLQKKEGNIATCGRHVVNRILHKQLTDDQYFNKFPDDKSVVQYTKKLLGR